jgi:glutathione S-transferase
MNVLDRTCSLEVSRWFDVAPETLFDAWLDESWGEWLAPGAVFCTSSIVNPKEGGRYSVVMRMPDGRDVTINGTYRQIERPTRLLFTWQADHTRAETLVTLTFRAKNGGTEMMLRHEGFTNAELRDRHNAGWTGANGSFYKLARWLADWSKLSPSP